MRLSPISAKLFNSHSQNRHVAKFPKAHTQEPTIRINLLRQATLRTQASPMVDYYLNALGSFMLKTAKNVTKDESDGHSLAEVFPHF